MSTTKYVPSGFLTRPKAAKVYNRAKKSLERDLEEAQNENDLDVLRAYKLVANDGMVMDAVKVTELHSPNEQEFVDSLKFSGKNPAWCVSEKYLSDTYGRKGASKPVKNDILNVEIAEPRGESSFTNQMFEEKTNADSESDYLPNDVQFLKQRVRELETEKLRLTAEKESEIARNEDREAKLFAQLAVKDTQISSWDGVTQSITRGLATGQLTPVIGLQAQTEKSFNATKQTSSAQPQERQNDTAAVLDVTTTTSAAKPKPKKQTAKKSSSSAKGAKKPKKQPKKVRKSTEPKTEPKQNVVKESVVPEQKPKSGWSWLNPFSNDET